MDKVAKAGLSHGYRNRNGANQNVLTRTYAAVVQAEPAEIPVGERGATGFSASLTRAATDLTTEERKWLLAQMTPVSDLDCLDGPE